MWNKHRLVSELPLRYSCIARIPQFLHIGPPSYYSIFYHILMVTFQSVPDITQVNLAGISKACFPLFAKTLSTLALSDGVAGFTLCWQPASSITSSPSLGHVMPLTGDGCLQPKDSWVMALILYIWGTITCHSQSVCCMPEQIDKKKEEEVEFQSEGRDAHHGITRFNSKVERI